MSTPGFAIADKVLAGLKTATRGDIVVRYVASGTAGAGETFCAGARGLIDTLKKAGLTSRFTGRVVYAGTPLPPMGLQLQIDIELRAWLGAFNKVRPEATPSDAAAYATGNDIAFDRGAAAPDLRTGRQLLGHELTHTVQQRVHGTVGGMAAAAAHRFLWGSGVYTPGGKEGRRLMGTDYVEHPDGVVGMGEVVGRSLERMAARVRSLMRP